MFATIGMVFTFCCIFVTYIAVGGNIKIILHALPIEMTMILGASIGAFLVANSSKTAKNLLKDLGKVFKGSKVKKQDYLDMLALMFQILKTIKTKGIVELEPQIEKPQESELFKKYPNILKDHFAIDLICDTLRAMTMNLDNPYHVEDAISLSIERHHHVAAHPAHSLQTVADGLPAIGIVAAVLGVIKTMGSITEPPEILGKMIGGALVGTFLGVFLAYCYIGPMASRLNEVIEEDGYIYEVIKKIFVAHLHGSAPQVSIELGRLSIPGYLQPTFKEVEEVQQK